MLLGVAVLWGVAFVPQKIASQHISAFAFTGIRFLVGAFLLSPWVWAAWRRRVQQTPLMDVQDFRSVALMGTLLFSGVAIQQFAVGYTSVTNAGFITGLYVPLVPLLAYVLYRRKPGKGVLPAATLCVVGIALLTSHASESGLPALPQLNWGDILILLTVLPFTLHVLWIGSVAERIHEPLLLAFGQFLICGVAASACALWFESISWSAIQTAFWPLAWTSIGSVTLGFTGQAIGQRYARPAEAAIILSAETLFAALAGAFWLGERLSVWGYLGGALIFASIIWVQRVPEDASSTPANH